jgi:hypothetical protein
MSDRDALDPAAATARQAFAVADVDDHLTGTSAALQRVCRGAVAALGTTGCAIHLAGRDGTTGLAASSDGWSTGVAEVTFATGEGPRIEAWDLRRPVLVSDLATQGRRWPGFAHAAGGLGVAAVFSFPLLVGGLALGVLELYAADPHELQDDEAALAMAFTELAIRTALGDEVVGDDETWEPLVDPRAEVHQAQGMVMVDLGVDLADALVRMRAFAFAEGIPLIDLARAIIAGFVLPETESGTSP